MFGKIQITGKIEVMTGMHIGTSDGFAAIGAVDSPVIRDAQTKTPMLPGSTLKGKLRTLLAKQYNKEVFTFHKDDAECIVNLFGSAAKPGERAKNSRLIFSDMLMANYKELPNRGTEVKFENTINRLTAMAMPRQIERVIRGAQFDLDIVYDVEPDADVIEDFKLLVEGFKLLQYDYLGGHGTRGYGKVRLENLCADAVAGDVDYDVVDECNRILSVFSD
jgi:CRISPR-associated RAMP protein, csm3 family